MNNSTLEIFDLGKKNGNEGDTVKHAVLARFTEQVFSEIGDGSFVYAESHTGRRSYILPEDGEWKNGIGCLSAELERLKLQVTDDPSQSKHRNIRPYLRTCFKHPMKEGASYPGSSGLVDLICRERGVVPNFHLCDTDEEVCRSLRASFGKQARRDNLSG
ncbi:hypothetical protein ACFL2Q_15900 [Thermodesulfobacteriota bacterium]